jgi:hypothetical protein
MGLMVMMVRRCGTRTRKRRSDFETELAFFSVAVIVTVAVRASAFICLVLVALLALVTITPDVVALQLAWLVTDRQSARWLDWSVVGRVWVVIMAIVFFVTESDESGALGVATDDGTERLRWRALAGARTGKVKVRHGVRNLESRWIALWYFQQ